MAKASVQLCPYCNGPYAVKPGQTAHCSYVGCEIRHEEKLAHSRKTKAEAKKAKAKTKKQTVKMEEVTNDLQS